MLFHWKSRYCKAPQYYVLHALPVSFDVALKHNLLFKGMLSNEGDREVSAGEKVWTTKQGVKQYGELQTLELHTIKEDEIDWTCSTTRHVGD